MITTKTVILCGREVTLYLRKCGGDCGEPTWFSHDTYVCNACLETCDGGGDYVPPRDIIRSEAQYEGGLGTQL
jgi:hypothetical protein